MLLVLAVVVAVAVLFVPRIPQPLSYHHFADQRSFLGVRNFGDVASNVPFAVIGLWGLGFLLRSNAVSLRQHFIDERERWPYRFVFAGLVLTALGSSYYHLDPSNARLVWDRLPMTMVFMALVAAVITERVRLNVGLCLLPILLVAGIGSVLQWYASELRGAGDLRPYATVQVYSGLVLLIAFVFPARYDRDADLWVVIAFYVVAKVFELLDKPIFSLVHIISGHTLKHLAAAGAGYWILRMLRKRRPVRV